MNKIKLNKIENFQLTKNEQQQLKGGEGGGSRPSCACGCCYAGTPEGQTLTTIIVLMMI